VGIALVVCPPKAGPPPRHASALAQRAAEANAGVGVSGYHGTGLRRREVNMKKINPLILINGFF